MFGFNSESIDPWTFCMAEIFWLGVECGSMLTLPQLVWRLHLLKAPKAHAQVFSHVQAACEAVSIPVALEKRSCI